MADSKDEKIRELEIRLKMVEEELEMANEEIMRLQKECIKKERALSTWGRKERFDLPDVKVIRELRDQGVPIAKIARDFGTTRNTIYKVLDNGYGKD